MILMATTSSGLGRLTCDFVSSTIYFGKVALTQLLREVEDIILYLLVGAFATQHSQTSRVAVILFKINGLLFYH